MPLCSEHLPFFECRLISSPRRTFLLISSIFSRPENRETSQAMLYTANAIAAHPNTRLETIDMVVIALLSGGDYSVSIRLHSTG